jgi:hypothetical protein
MRKKLYCLRGCITTGDPRVKSEKLRVKSEKLRVKSEKLRVKS